MSEREGSTGNTHHGERSRGPEWCARAKVRDYMHSPVLRVAESDLVADVLALFTSAQITGAPVVDLQGRVTGVLSLTDLMALRLFGSNMHLRNNLLAEDAPHAWRGPTSPSLRARELMTPSVWSAAPDESLLDAALRMRHAGVHRLVVLEASDQAGSRPRPPLGILSALDFLRVVADAELDAPISKYATRKVATVETGTPARDAVRGLLDGHYTGMPVVEQGWPVGFLSPMELLGAEGDLGAIPVEELATAAMLCVPDDTPIGHVAREAMDKGIRRILAVSHRHVTGILTSVDVMRAFIDGANDAA